MEKMMIGNAVVTMLAVSAMAMAFLLTVEGGRDMVLKEAKVLHNPKIFNENLGYKPRDEYDRDMYKYKDRDCYEYGTCDKSPPYCDDGDHQYNWDSTKQQLTEYKEVAGKYGGHQNFP